MQLDLSDDLHEFLALLNSTKVEFVLVGAYALAYHGAPRFTEDIDFFVAPTPENADNLAQVIEAFGFGSLRLTPADFQHLIKSSNSGEHRIELISSLESTASAGPKFGTSASNPISTATQSPSSTSKPCVRTRNRPPVTRIS